MSKEMDVTNSEIAGTLNNRAEGKKRALGALRLLSSLLFLSEQEIKPLSGGTAKESQKYERAREE